jgi:glutamine synthetase
MKLTSEKASATYSKEALEDHNFNMYLNAKKKAWEEYLLNISQWKLNRYFRM